MSLFLIAVSLSIDALGIGAAYGVRNIKIPMPAKLIICALTVIITFISVFLGKLVSTFLPSAVATVIGTAILFGMGIWIIRQARNSGVKEAENKSIDKPETILHIFIKWMGISIKIIRDPQTGDSNNSNKIEPAEAVYLGVALCIDSLGAGFAGAVSGVGYLSIPFLAAMFQMLFLYAGTLAGSKLRSFSKIDECVWTYVSGMALIFLGVVRAISIF